MFDRLLRVKSLKLFRWPQAISFRKESSSEFIESVLEIYRKEVTFIDKDRVLNNDIEKSISFLKNLSIDQELI